MARQQENRWQILRISAGEPLSANAIARLLNRGPGDTKALADRLADAGYLARVPHPTRAQSWLYQATTDGLASLTEEPLLLGPDSYLILLREPVTPATLMALVDQVSRAAPMWMLRVHGPYRMMIAYADGMIADRVQAALAAAADDGGAATVVRTGTQRFPMTLGT